MKKYNYLHPYYLSFYAKSLYKDVAGNWKGTGFLYVLLLLAITWLPIMYIMHNGVSHYFKTSGTQIVNQIPEITIKDGEVSVDTSVPHFIKDPNTNKIVAIIDTSGQFTNLDNTPAKALLTKTKIYVRQNGNQIREYDIAKHKDFTFTRAYIKSWAVTIKNWVIVLLYPFLLFASFVYRIILLLIYAATFGLLFNYFMKTNLEFKTILRLAAIAITPAVILSTVFDFFSIVFSFQALLYFLLSIVYLSFGINANKVESSESEIMSS